MDLTLWPVRCFTCGKVLAIYKDSFYDLLKQGLTPKEALDRLGLERYCCRMRAISYPQMAPGYLIPQEESNLVSVPERTYNQEGVLPSMQSNARIMVRQPRYSTTRTLSMIRKSPAKIRQEPPKESVQEPQIKRRFPAI